MTRKDRFARNGPLILNTNAGFAAAEKATAGRKRQTMRKKIVLVSLLVSVIAIVLLAVLFSGIYYRGMVAKTQEQLKTYMSVYESERAETDISDPGVAAAFSQKLSGARVTLLATDGSVLSDSAQDAETAENHADREEVMEALDSGEGYAVRRSATVGEQLVYYCKAFTDGTDGYLLRLAVSSPSLFGVFADSLPTFLWLLIAELIICMMVAWLSTSFVLRPVEQLTHEAATGGGREVRTEYPELQPIAKMMNDMNADIHEKVEKMREDSRLEKLILDSMEHGIVIFRDPTDIILINKTAARLLDYEPNEPIVCFKEDREIAEILVAGEAASLYRKIDGRDFNFRFTFNDKSRVLLITDVTESMAAARSKNDFIANVTHEMNTPLTSIRGFAELIAADAVPPERIGHAARTIIRQSDRLSKLIRRIIDFSAIDSDELPEYEVDLSALLCEIIPTFEPRFSQKNITFTQDIADGVKVNSRRERLVEIANNLISNGIRYNKEGGSLSVRLTGGETPVLTVSDTGIGLSEEDKTRIFDRFYTVDKSHNGAGGGFGLGLAIVKKLCRRAGWKLSVESKLGEGTSFIIEFSPKKAE